MFGVGVGGSYSVCDASFARRSWRQTMCIRMACLISQNLTLQNTIGNPVCYRSKVFWRFRFWKIRLTICMCIYIYIYIYIHTYEISPARRGVHKRTILRKCKAHMSNKQCLAHRAALRVHLCGALNSCVHFYECKCSLNF